MYSAKELAIARQIKPDIEVTQLDVTDLAVLQLVRKATGGGSGVYNATIENGIATFGGVVASQPLVSLLLNIPVTQQGSGTPSPTNIRDFVSVSQAVIGQTSDYGEYFRGLLNGTYGFVDLGSLTWAYNTNYSCWRPQGWTVPNNSVTSNDIPIVGVSSEYTIVKAAGYTSSHENNTLAVNVNANLFVDNGSDTIEPSGYLIYELAEPSAPSITPQEFAMLCQAFGITGNTYTISFGQTVYSAILDVLTGKLSITHKIVDLGDLEWKYTSATTRFYTDDITDISLEANFTDMFCSGYDVISSANSFANMPDKSIKRGVSSAQISIRDLDYTDASLFTTAVTGMKLVYELAEPIEVQLTPTIINTLIGDNVIFADVGDVTECKYTRK